MPEGHTTHALAERLAHAFSGTVVSVSSPQGRFEDGAALLDASVLVGASAWGKHLFVQFEGDRWLNVHLGLIGKFSVKRHLVAPGPGAGSDTDPQTPGMPNGSVPVVGQVRLRLLNDTWVGDLRGPTICAVITPEKVHEIQARLGPDPLRPDADPDLALRRIIRSNKPIAELLMDQAVLAGVGNVYRCEVLFRHRVDPFRPGREIRPTTWQAIWDDLTKLMPLGVAFGQILTMDDQVVDALAEVADGSAAAHTEAVTGARLGDRFERRVYLYPRTGKPCRTCGSAVRTQLIAGRNLFWCGRCQRRR